MELRPGTPKEAGMLPEQIDRARDLCAGWVKSGHTPAIVALVARRGVIVLHEAFGKLRPEADSPPVRLDTVFPVTSITKPMTATLVMCLVEDGLLGLNRPVVDYLPEMCGEGTDQILVHHLLTHTSGFNEEEIEPYTEQKMSEGSVEIGPHEPTQHPLIHSFLTLRWSAPLWKPPGAELVEEIPAAFGGVFSTAMNLAIFGQTFLNGGRYGSTRLLSGPSVAAMTRDQNPGIGMEFAGRWYEDSAYGYGWFVHTGGVFPYVNGSLWSLGSFAHSGVSGGLLWVDPVEGIVGVYLEVLMQQVKELLPLWNADLFQNVVTSAVED